MDLEKIKRLVRYIVKGVPNIYKTIDIRQNITNEELKGKNILVTGASRGIGYYIAKLAIKKGAKVLICARKEDTLRKAAEELGGNCKFLIFDVSDVTGMQSFLDKSFQLMGGRIDCLVNNAGISFHEGSFRNVTVDGFNAQFDVNFRGSYFLAKYYIEKVEALKQESGNVLFITSERGSFYTEIPYGLSKASIKSLVGSLNRSVYKTSNIRVNALAPGVTASDMTGHDINGDYNDERSPIGRIFHPYEMASVACFLMSDNSTCIAGETIHCDGGRHENVIN